MSDCLVNTLEISFVASYCIGLTIDCDMISHINRKAREYAEQERRDNNITENGIYGCDVPDDLCYQWAIDYFTDPNADKEPEKKATQKAAPAGTAKAKTRTAQKKKDPAPRTEDCEQITLMEEAV